MNIRKAIKVIDSVDVYVKEEESEDDEYQIWEENFGHDHENDEAPQQYLNEFQISEIGKKSIKVNPLLPPTLEEEGRRDQRTVRLEKYFGDESRLDFFERSSWVNEKRNIMNSKDNIAEKIVMPPKDDYAVNFAFAPQRFDGIYDECDDDGQQGGNGVEAQTTYTSAPTNMAASVSSLSTIESMSTLHTSCSTIERGMPTSPRTRFIGNCIKNGINPRASLIIRRNVSSELILKHQVKRI